MAVKNYKGFVLQELIPVPRHSNLINLYFVFFFVCRLMVVLVSRRYETMLFAWYRCWKIQQKTCFSQKLLHKILYYQIFLMFKFGLVSTRNMILMTIVLVLLLRTFELLHLHRFVNFFPREWPEAIFSTQILILQKVLLCFFYLIS